MPTKRRKFSVQGSLPNSNPAAKSSQTREIALGPDTEKKSPNTNSKRLRMKKIYPLASFLHPSLEVLAESDTDVLLYNDCSKERIQKKTDKAIEAISFDIDLVTKTKSSNTAIPKRKSSHVPRTDGPPRNHRVKVRSPKRRPTIIVNYNEDNVVHNNKSSVGVNTNEETDTQSDSETELHTDDTLDDENVNHSLIDPCNSSEDMCRICHGGASLAADFGPLVSACACRGTVGCVHVKCLEHWLTESGKTRCELCGTKYETRRIHRYGICRALLKWLFSQNSKQLIVDCLGIILMSPLAVFATWLSGKTLTGLMRKEDEVAPWPLTSTFVLACMTLVCYYCWVISAVTRHSLGWWTWYRSQYEVRLNTT